MNKVTLTADMIPHGLNINAHAATGAFDHGEHTRIGGGHYRSVASKNVMSLNQVLYAMYTHA